MSKNNLNILFIFNNCKSIQYIFDAVIKLSENNKIYYYFNHQTSRSIFKWNDLFTDESSDIIIKYEKILKDNGCFKLGESITKDHGSKKNIDHIRNCFKKINKLDICIIDNSNGFRKGNSHGFNYIYKIIKKYYKNVNVIGCIEGLKDFNCKNFKDEIIKETQLESIRKSLGICYDYIFCSNTFENKIFNDNKNLKKKICKVGLPYLDKFKKYKNISEEKYVILFTSWPKLRRIHKWKPLNEKIIKDIIIYVKKLNLKLIIKEKPRNKFSYKNLEDDNVIVTMCEGDELNDFISKSKFIISVPSSVLLRGLILNKPIIILNDQYYGQLGFLKDFNGIIDNINIKEIEDKLLFFNNNKNYINNFIKENLYGYDFNATNLFIQSINSIVSNKI